MAKSNTSGSPADRRELVQAWRRLADDLKVSWKSQTRSWKQHIERDGVDDEERLVQPLIFPGFAARILGWEIGLTISPEAGISAGRPDFTPADPVTYPFVFETKGSRQGVALNDRGSLQQVERYLREGRPQITKVALTNFVGLRVFTLDESDGLIELYSANLRDLLVLDEEQALSIASAAALERFVDEFSHRTLTREAKIESVRNAADWGPFAVTSSDWIIRRLDRIVEFLHRDVTSKVGSLADPATLSEGEREAITRELQDLAARTASGLDDLTIDECVVADVGTPERLVLDQYTMHVAYYVATRLLLVRIWEDLKLLDPMLYDGGFDTQMDRADGVIADAVDNAFRQARHLYRPLFANSSNYDWYEPSEDAYVDVVYELASTYLGAVTSDVLGEVYERLLARIDRKLLGQYYTPRDVIALIWDLIGIDEIAEAAEQEERTPRILDIATGSGGFLVDGVARLRARLKEQLERGASITPQEWVNAVAENTVGVEIQYFSRYLAEVNLLVQVGQVVAEVGGLRVPQVGVIAADTLSLCQPLPEVELLEVPSDQPTRAKRVKDVVAEDFAIDVTCGNPPYLGEGLAAPILKRLREEHPYWRRFLAEHQDYLYFFLILGISKLRRGGRFGFITTEYWLRAGGARPLREYLARHCAIERMLLFRDLRLFPDAPGQHSMIIVGERLTDVDGADDFELDPPNPKVSIYGGANLRSVRDRAGVIDAMRNGVTASQVKSFTSLRSPNRLGGDSWADVTRTKAQLRVRDRLGRDPQMDLMVSKGVEATFNALSNNTAPLLTEDVKKTLGWPDQKAGIQLLSQEEVDRLGALDDEERALLRPVINTRDVYPYAALVSDPRTYLIYLPKPDGIRNDQAMSIAQEMAFPAGLPNVERHLNQVRPILQAAVRERRERRPWWSLHRARHDVVGDGSPGPWEPFCLTTRWGNGGRLVVGVAEGGAVPASGLHIVRGTGGADDALLLAAIFNSSLYQEVVDSLPPGNLRSKDLSEIGMPSFMGESRKALVEHATALAELVRELVQDGGSLFPSLPDSLRFDVDLVEWGSEAWTPTAEVPTLAGPLGGVGWVKEVIPGRARSRLADVVAQESLFGNVVEATGPTGASALRIELDAHAPDGASEALVALLRGAAVRGLNCEDIAALSVPIDGAEFVGKFQADRTTVSAKVDRYRELRAVVDSLVIAASAAG